MHLIQDSSGALICRDTDAFATRAMTSAPSMTIMKPPISCSKFVSYFFYENILEALSNILYVIVDLSFYQQTIYIADCELLATERSLILRFH